VNTLIINLTRFGDLLQTQPVISGFARAGHRVGLVCLDNFAPATALLEDVDAVYPLSGGSLLAALDADWRTALGGVWQWGDAVVDDFVPESLLNLTATTSVRLLASHLSGKAAGSGDTETDRLRGFGLDTFGFSMNSDPWTTFLQASTRLRGCSPFNLVDLYWMASGLGAGPRVYALREPLDEHRDAARALLQQAVDALGPEGRKVRGFVGLQLGASEDRRRWPLAHFAELGDRLWAEEGLLPVLLGAGSERHLAEGYARHASLPHADLVGKTGLPVLAAALRELRLLVTNDTGTMHLAAGLGVPILAVFLATAQPWDTGPYREGSCSLEPDLACHPCPFGTVCPHDLACRTRISSATMFALVRAWLQGGAWHAPTSGEARIWETRRDDAGFMDLQSLSGHEETDRTRWVRQQRFFYGQFLDRVPASRMGEGALRTIAPPPWPVSLSADRQAAVEGELEQSVMLLHLLAEQGRVLAVRPTDTTKQRFLGTWQRLQTLWDNSAMLNVLGYLWMCESQEAGNDLSAMLTLAEQYHRLATVWLSAMRGVL